MPEILQGHEHESVPEDWPFEDEPTTMVITTRRIASGQLHVIGVAHDDDGDWQFLDGGSTEPEDGIVSCLQCIYERAPHIAEMATLPMNHIAWLTQDGSWNVTEQLPEVDESP